MKKTFLILILMCFISYFSGISTNAQVLDVNTLFTTLKNELVNTNVSANDLSSAEQPIKKMLGMGVSVADVKSMLLDFVAKGLKGSTLGSLVTSVSDLMKNAGSFKSAVGFVTQAIQQAGATGLKGDDLVAKVQGIVSQKKASSGLLETKSVGSLFGK